MAVTLRMANQNSNSPKFFTPARLMAVNRTMKTRDSAQTGITGQTENRSPAAPSASAAITTTSCSHQSQPTVPLRSCPWLFGVDGERAAVGVGRGHLAQRPHDQDDQGTGDEVGDQDCRSGRLDSSPEPRNRPAPIALPSPIMVSWRGSMLCPRGDLLGPHRGG